MCLLLFLPWHIFSQVKDEDCMGRLKMLQKKFCRAEAVYNTEKGILKWQVMAGT